MNPYLLIVTIVSSLTIVTGLNVQDEQRSRKFEKLRNKAVEIPLHSRYDVQDQNYNSPPVNGTTQEKRSFGLLAGKSSRSNEPKEPQMILSKCVTCKSNSNPFFCQKPFQTYFWEQNVSRITAPEAVDGQPTAAKCATTSNVVSTQRQVI